MNLNKNPTVRQLKDLFRVADDEAGHHILWVNKEGDVRVTLLPGDVTPFWLGECVFDHSLSL